MMLTIRIEKETASIGLFLASRRRTRREPERRILLPRTVGAQRVDADVTLRPHPSHGFPNVEDQDRFLAFQGILTGIYRRCGEIRNPVLFHTSDLLRILRRNPRSGRHHERVTAWLGRLSTLRIQSREAIYLAGSRCLATGEFSILDRVLTAGDVTTSGDKAGRNMVWLSSWILDNLNHDHAFSLDFDGYIELETSVARALVLPLHVWFYASRNAGRFEKRIDSLSRFLGFSPGLHRSRRSSTIDTALSELHRHGYLSRWKTVHTPAGEKIVLSRGKRFIGCAVDDRALTPTFSRQPEAPDPMPADSLPAALIHRGIAPHAAHELAVELASRQEIFDQLEWGDYLLRKRQDITNPAGFYIHLLRNNVVPPAGFMTGRRQKLLEAARKTREKEDERQARLESAYRDYREEALDSHITNLPQSEYVELLTRKRQELSARYPRFSKWSPESAERCVKSAVREEIERDLPLCSFEDFRARGTISIPSPLSMTVMDSPPSNQPGGKDPQ